MGKLYLLPFSRKIVIRYFVNRAPGGAFSVVSSQNSQRLTERDVYDGGTRSNSERGRYRCAGVRYAVQHEQIAVLVDREIRAEEVASVSGEIVGLVDGETSLDVERRQNRRLRHRQMRLFPIEKPNLDRKSRYNPPRRPDLRGGGQSGQLPRFLYN